MATSEQNKELIDDIKRPIRYYRLRVWGYGGEIVYGKSSKEEFDYWNSEQARLDCRVEEEDTSGSETLSIYMFEKEDDSERFEKVPEQFRRVGDWYEQDDIEHSSGVEWQTAFLELVELAELDHNAEVIATIADGDAISNFVDETKGEYIVGDIDVQPYMFYGMSEEKGEFISALFEVNGRIDLSKLKFIGTEFPNGSELVHSVLYDEVYLDDDGPNTNGKGLYIEIVET